MPDTSRCNGGNACLEQCSQRKVTIAERQSKQITISDLLRQAQMQPYSDNEDKTTEESARLPDQAPVQNVDGRDSQTIGSYAAEMCKACPEKPSSLPR